jgi:hypothetical protein
MLKGNLLIQLHIFRLLCLYVSVYLRLSLIAPLRKLSNIRAVSTDRHALHGRGERTSQEAIHQDDEKDYRE